MKNRECVPTTISVMSVSTRGLAGLVRQNQRRARADTTENAAKYNSISKLKVSRMRK